MNLVMNSIQFFIKFQLKIYEKICLKKMIRKTWNTAVELINLRYTKYISHFIHV